MLTTATSNLYSRDGSLSGNRTLNAGLNPLTLNGNAGKNAFTIRRDNNNIEQGLAFSNSNGFFAASIFMETSTRSGLAMASNGSSGNVNSLLPTIVLNDNRSVTLPNYGKGSNTSSSAAQLLGVSTTGTVTETPFNNFKDNVYNSNGGLNGPRLINTGNHKLKISNSGNRDMQIIPADPASDNNPFIFLTDNAFDFKINDFNALRINGAYRIVAERYGLGNIQGKPTALLGVEAGGNVIEFNTPPPGVQFYSTLITPQLSPSIEKIETDSVIGLSGWYTELLDFKKGAQDSMKPGEDGFIIKMVGTYDVKTAGVFNFTSVSDDGARIYIDGSLILDAWIDSGNAIGNGSANLSKGKHKFTFYYYENAGGEKFTFSWGKNPDLPSGVMKGSDFTIE